MACHTRPGGQPFAGGYGLNTPFGIIYGTNITPDPETGIGRWSLEAFARAMREGVSRDGSHLFPAFPYYAYTELWDDDLKALYAYLMTRPPVSATVQANTIPFPLNIRALQEGWKILFFRSGRYRPDPSKGAEWNRGAYLAEALSDCGGYANLYAAACMSCHYNAGPVPLPARPELALNSALTLPEPTNFIQVVLKGISNTEGAPGLVMPAYASSLTDAEIARLAAYLRRSRTKLPPWTDLENQVAAIRRESAASH